MTFTDVISEAEAALVAGVSARTLLRFSESGYLTVQPTPDGGRSYSRGQILEIFGAPSTTTSQPNMQAEPSAERAEASPLTSHEINVTTSTSPTASEYSTTASALMSQQLVVEESARLSSAAHSEENVRLKNLISMQERMLDAKDDEIADLRNQRAWLRERIEKLEEKSDRDQILLLSETQTIRQLIAVQESKKTVVQHMLEWIGVGKSSDVPTIASHTDYSQKKTASGSSRTIEVDKAAN